MPTNNSASSGEFLLYDTEDGRTRVKCRVAEDTLWLSQAMMAELFRTSPQNINLHLKAVYAEGEISAEATCKNYLQVRSEGARFGHGSRPAGRGEHLGYGQGWKTLVRPAPPA